MNDDDRDRIAKLFSLAPDSESLQQSLTHTSYANENPDATDNQRLEFLGDAVLQLCSSEILYETFPQANEGELTRMRAQLVNTKALASYAREQNLAQAMLVGRGADAGGLRTNHNVLADVVEALIAASYLDGGLEAARRACRAVVHDRLKHFEGDAVLDCKTALQQRVQAAARVTPRYTLLENWGPPHDRWFRVAVEVGEAQLATGVGRSKRGAEQEAAKAALPNIDTWLEGLEGDV